MLSGEARQTGADDHEAHGDDQESVGDRRGEHREERLVVGLRAEVRREVAHCTADVIEETSCALGLGPGIECALQKGLGEVRHALQRVLPEDAVIGADGAQVVAVRGQCLQLGEEIRATGEPTHGRSVPIQLHRVNGRGDRRANCVITITSNSYSSIVIIIINDNIIESDESQIEANKVTAGGRCP